MGEYKTPGIYIKEKTVLVAISRPAEFIEITFWQQMQESR